MSEEILSPEVTESIPAPKKKSKKPLWLGIGIGAAGASVLAVVIACILVVIILLGLLLCGALYVFMSKSESTNPGFNTNTNSGTNITIRPDGSMDATIPGNMDEVVDQTVPCTGVTIEGLESYTFTGINESYMLSVTCDPAGTTDELIWHFDNNVVALEKVGNYWYLSPVAPGETTVTVICGEYYDSITIYCDFVITIPCTGITINNPACIFTDLNDSICLTVICTPADTTDEMTWDFDENVVALEKVGNHLYLSPVAPGRTTVTVTCGDYSASMHVVCNFEVNPNFVLTWACDKDVTLTGYGTSLVIYNGSVDVSEITFTSSNEEVATVVGNRVYIWKNGQATIIATYEGQGIIMIVRAINVVPPEEDVSNGI